GHDCKSLLMEQSYAIELIAALTRFFFQAEDGIRDFHVTGVQTCALPILSVYEAEDGRSAMEITRELEHPFDIIVTDIDMPGMDRSEERRVGKECRSWWSTKQ